MFKSLKTIRRNWHNFVHFDPESEALKDAGDRIDIELIHRSFAKQNRRGPFGY